MSQLVIPGVVRDGKVWPQAATMLPEGAHVEILLGDAEVTPALRAEFLDWDSASDEAWNLIDEWEQNEP